MFQVHLLELPDSAVLYPFKFQPIFKERIWGGRELERLYGKTLPPGKIIGESWEISDRPGDTSIVTNGPFAGNDLRWLMETHERELLGDAKPTTDGRFPLLIKLLDAREKLSLQVHPPASKAAELEGEPKTEMWFIADAAPEADLFVGLKYGITRAEFDTKIQNGQVSECLHRIPVCSGDAMFLPSGRVHAIGAGLVIFEVQQNSDTTYRVFDWNRVGLDGKPRELHIQQSLASIDFNDFEPALVKSDFEGDGGLQIRPLVADPLFKVEQWKLQVGSTIATQPLQMQIFAALEGSVSIGEGHDRVELSSGGFCLIPASVVQTTVRAESSTSLLHITAGN